MSEEIKKLVTFKTWVIHDEGRIEVRKKVVVWPEQKEKFFDREYGYQHYQFSVFWREVGKFIRTALVDRRKVSLQDVSIEVEDIHRWDNPDTDEELQIEKSR